MASDTPITGERPNSQSRWGGGEAVARMATTKAAPFSTTWIQPAPLSASPKQPQPSASPRPNSTTGLPSPRLTGATSRSAPALLGLAPVRQESRKPAPGSRKEHEQPHELGDRRARERDRDRRQEDPGGEEPVLP